MNKDREAVENEKNYKIRRQISLSIVVLAALFIAVIYIMIFFPTNFIIIGIAGILMLIMVYRVINLFFAIQEERENRRKKEFESLFKSQKASYFLLRSNFEDIDEKLEKIKNDTGLPVEELISAQKSIAKVTINRSKENSTAIMNSNEELKSHLYEMDDKFSEIQNIVKENVQNFSEIVSREVESTNEYIISKISEAEESIYSKIDSRLNDITIAPAAGAEVLKEESIASENTVSEPLEEELSEMPEIKELSEEFEIPEISVPSDDMPETEMLSEETEDMPDIEILPEETSESSIEPRVEPLTEEISSQSMEELEEKVRELQKQAAEEEPEISTLEVNTLDEDLILPMEDIPTSENASHKMTPEEIEQLINKKEMEEETLPEMDLSSASEEIPSMEEIESMLASIPLPEDNAVKEPEPLPEEKKEPDANHIMTPDEIASLIGESPTPAPEPTPEPTPAPVSNDSNHVMTPDEIAALLASI